MSIHPFQGLFASAEVGTLVGPQSVGNEARRLAALERYGVLDTSAEQMFDGIVALAGDLFSTPIALVSLLDWNRQWFKARTGLDASETSRSVAFCEHAIQRPDEVLVVPDASEDPRFAANPLVTGAQRIRFYAGAPLVTPDGLPLGTVCVLSPESRPGGLSFDERRRLQQLASMAMAALELRLKARQAAQSAARAEAFQITEERLRLALEVAGACAWELDPVSGQSLWDPAARRLLGIAEIVPFEDALEALVHPEDLGRVRAAIIAALLPGGSGQYSVEHRAVPDRWVQGTQPVRWLQSLGQAYFEGEAGSRQAVRMVCITMDITERCAATERQALLVGELNHRVKNTLAVVLAISQLTQRSAEQRIERHRFHGDFQARLQALARAHDVLTRESWRGAALGDVVNSVFAPYRAGTGTRAQVTVDGPPVQLASEPAVALAMVLHELATNAAKHGALSVPSGSVGVSWQICDRAAELRLRWTETGGPMVTPPQHRGFGSRMLEASVRQQLGGSFSASWLLSGLACQITVPMARMAPRQ